jgi:hypothetical protein
MDLKAYQAKSDVLCTKDDKGNWTVEQVITQRRKVEDGDWEEKSITSVAINTEVERAMAEVQVMMNYYLADCDGDLFNTDESKLDWKPVEKVD